MKPQLLKSLRILHTRIDPTEGFRYGTVCDNFPNSSLLKDNALFDAIINNNLYLSHQTTKYELIKKDRKINPGWGCLGSVLYTTPIYVQKENFSHDNFFNLVLSHQNNTKMEELIIKNESPLELYGTNYLFAGLLLFEIAGQTYIKDTIEYKYSEVISDKALEIILNEKSIENISLLAKKDPFFAFLYYESLSQVIMLCASDELTLNLLEKGEFNAHCYYDIIKEFSGIYGERFDASNFDPNQSELYELLVRLSKNSSINIDIDEVVKNTIEVFYSIVEQLNEDGDLKKHLTGQVLKSTLSEKNKTFLLGEFDRQVGLYREANKISLVINTATFKPEIGVPLGSKISFFKRDGRILSKLDIDY